MTVRRSIAAALAPLLPVLLVLLAPSTAVATAKPATQSTTGAATTPTQAPDAAPLDRYVATLDTAALDDEALLQQALRTAETRLAAAAPPRTDCAAGLGAERYAALHRELARARAAVGDRAGARAAWQAAIECAPRRPAERVGLAKALLALGELDAAEASLARAREFAAAGAEPRSEPGLEYEQLQARIDYAAARWSAAATRAARIVVRLQKEHDAARLSEGAARAPRTLPPQPAVDDLDSALVTFWRILEQLARRRAGEPRATARAMAPELAGRWPEPLWHHLQGALDERALVARIRAEESPRRRRELSCEALYYTAQMAFADGRDEFARRRLARVVNLKVPYFEEHELALAELARLRRSP